MTRQETYAKIKELGLQSEVESQLGVNFTRAKTADLEQIIWNYDCTQTDRDPSAGDETEEDAPVAKQAPADVDNGYKAACLVFLGVLKDSNLLDDLLEEL